MSYIVELLYRLPAIMVAIAFHECAHAYAAYKRGDPTAYNLGRMTLNPLAHIDPIGFVMLIVARFGWAKPVPINTRNFKNPRKDEIIVSLAGVATNLVLAFIFLGVQLVLIEVFKVSNAALITIIYYFYFINLGLAVFNLIPIPPLDGYHVASCLLMRRMGAKPFMFLERYGFIVLIALLATGVLGRIMGTAVTWIANGMFEIYNALFSLIGVF